MEKYQATKAVAKAAKITKVFAYITLIAGFCGTFAGFIMDTRQVLWDVVLQGGSLIGASISLFIIYGLLRGVESITKASEIYIEKNTETQE